MYVGWMLSKTGMLLGFIVFFSLLYTTYQFYEEYSAKMEVDITVQEIADQIAVVANSAPEYSVDSQNMRIVTLPEHIHGEPYKFTINQTYSYVKIELLGRYTGENISAFAMLPLPAIRNEAGNNCLVIEGFNGHGEVSVGVLLDDTNISNRLEVSKRIDTGKDYTDYTVSIKAIQGG